MKAVILVGGFGTRLRPLTFTNPKQMLPVGHESMIEHVIRSLGSHGVTEAVLALGYKQDVFTNAFPDGICAGVKLHYAVEPEPLDTAGAIGFAARHAGIDERFVVVNGDIITDMNLGELWKFHRDAGAQATISLTPVDDPSRYGVVPTDDDGRVVGFIEKPPRDEAPTNWINAGTYVLEPSVLELIEPGRRVSVERETFPALAESGTLYAKGSEAYWVDSGTPATYLQIQLDLLDGLRGEAIDGVHSTATVDPEASVVRSVIAAGAAISAGAIVRNSIIFPRAVIGANATVDGSMIGGGATVGDGASVTGLSVIGDAAKLDPGSSLDGAKLPDAQG
ncbi:MAG: NDP-sugar synthase [Acidimicrobiales bacterium]